VPQKKGRPGDARNRRNPQASLPAGAAGAVARAPGAGAVVAVAERKRGDKLESQGTARARTWALAWRWSRRQEGVCCI
jgi:hypothetical protein